MLLIAQSWLSTPRHGVFPFFADAGNLQALTPPWLHFAVITSPPLAMHEGLIITYRIRLHGVPIRWTSQIPTYDPPRMFVDRQISGPYRHWVHTHRFIEERGGTRILDEIEFEVPFRRLATRPVARQLERIFLYRHQALLGLFHEPQPWPAAQITIT